MATILPYLYGLCLDINATFSESYATNVISAYGLADTNGYLYIGASPTSSSSGDGCSLIVNMWSDLFAASYVGGSGTTNHCGDKTYMSMLSPGGGVYCRVNILKFLSVIGYSSFDISCRVTQSDIFGLGASTVKVGWRVGNPGPTALVGANLTSCPASFTQSLVVTVYDNGTFTAV